MKAIFRHVCAARARTGCDAEEIELEFEIPFLPAAGMMIAANDRSDLLKVDEVFWFAERPSEVELYAVDDEEKLRPFSYWRKQGWKRS